MRSRRTKATDISQRVKLIVWERDEHQCVICGNHEAMPNSHYIKRSQGGLGSEENVVTMCVQCHHDYDHTDKRENIKVRVREYLMNKYPDWNEGKLIYEKWGT